MGGEQKWVNGKNLTMYQLQCLCAWSTFLAVCSNARNGNQLIQNQH